jgi:adenine/guanine phosphoribosyltransferase-like PRPP-binding protein
MKPQEFMPHDFWQAIAPPGTFDDTGGFSTFYPARFADGRQLCLPLRQLPDGEHAVASLIVNQASFGVLDALAEALAAQLAPLDPHVVVGVPTLGLTLAAAVARNLAHARYVPLGTSRKFWYREDLSVPLSSITTPDQQKRLYIDPRMLPLLEKRRVVVVDDVISSGASMAAALTLLAVSGIAPAGIGAAMLQTDRWREKLGAVGEPWPARVSGVLKTPLFVRGASGLWRPVS